MTGKDLMRTVSMIAAAAIVVAGCSARPPSRSRPHTTPTSAAVSHATSPAPSTSAPRTGPLTTGAGVRPGEKPPVENAAAHTHSELGAMAFARYYEQALDWSLATSDPYLLKQISAPTCASCNRYIANLENLRRGNGHVIGGRITIGTIGIAEGKHLVKADLVVKVQLEQSPMSVVRPSAAPSVVTSRAEHPSSYIHLLWANGQWTVTGDFGP